MRLYVSSPAKTHSLLVARFVLAGVRDLLTDAHRAPTGIALPNDASIALHRHWAIPSLREMRCFEAGDRVGTIGAS